MGLISALVSMVKSVVDVFRSPPKEEDTLKRRVKDVMKNIEGGD